MREIRDFLILAPVVALWAFIAANIKWFALPLAIVLFYCGCKPMPSPAPPAPLKASCGSACDNAGRKLHCDAWLDVDAGESCQQRCAAVLEDNTVQFDLECVTSAGTCAAVDGC